MNDYLIHNRVALGFAIGSFGFLTIGSLLSGATPSTAFIRGIEAALIFGVLAWASAYFFLKEDGFDSHHSSDDSGQEKTDLID